MPWRGVALVEKTAIEVERESKQGHEPARQRPLRRWYGSKTRREECQACCGEAERRSLRDGGAEATSWFNGKGRLRHIELLPCGIPEFNNHVTICLATNLGIGWNL